MSTTSDGMDSALPGWVASALREPVVPRAGSRTRIMDAIRTLPTPRRHAPPMRPSRWLRRGLLSPTGGFVSAAMLALVVLLRTGTGGHDVADLLTATTILGDSVVPSHAAAGDDGRWLDTLHVVEFVIRGSSVRAAAVLGDFNSWQRGATPLVDAGRHEWRARALVSRDALRLAYLVNGARIIPVTSLLSARR